MVLVLAGGTGWASAYPLGQSSLNSFKYPSQFDNLEYNISGNNTISLNGTLEFTDNSTVKPIAGAYLWLAIIEFTNGTFSFNSEYHGVCVTDQNGKFQFNSGQCFIGFPGNYTLLLSYHGNHTYQRCNLTFDI